MNTNEQFAERIPERDIARLEEEVSRHARMPENKEREGRDVVRDAIQSLHNEQELPQNAPDAARSAEQAVLPPYAESAPAEVKQEIERLLQSVLDDGLEKAMRQARKESPFILDAFHDALVDNFYPILQQRGLVS